MSEYNSQDPGKPQPLPAAPSLAPFTAPFCNLALFAGEKAREQLRLAEVYARDKSEQMQKSKRFASMATPTTSREERTRAR